MGSRQLVRSHIFQMPFDKQILAHVALFKMLSTAYHAFWTLYLRCIYQCINFTENLFILPWVSCKHGRWLLSMWSLNDFHISKSLIVRFDDNLKRIQLKKLLPFETASSCRNQKKKLPFHTHGLRLQAAYLMPHAKCQSSILFDFDSINCWNWTILWTRW